MPRFFFLGGDCAPSDSYRSDDGALVVGCAEPKGVPEPGEMFSQQESDWWFTPVYARVLTSRERASSRQWSGYIYHLDQRFCFEKICLDPNQGGVMVGREMLSHKQLINGVETQVRVIGDQVNAPKLVVDARYILHFWKRGDPGLEAMYAGLAGDDELKGALLGSSKDGLDLGIWRLVPDAPRETFREWPQERQWAGINLKAMRKQLLNINVLKNNDGLFIFTKRGAHTFESASKDDIAYAWMYCYQAFRMWLKMGDFTPQEPGDAGCMRGW